MSPDEICREYANSELKIKVSELEDSVLIEGTADSLLFLSKLFAAQADSSDESYSISPTGAGMSWFAAGSTKGIYIHRTEG